MTNNKSIKKSRVFGISEEMDDLLILYSSKENVSFSKLIRSSLREKLEKLKLEEEKFWSELPSNKLNEILLSLTEYLNSKLKENESQHCEHSNLWEDNYNLDFEYTKKFCSELQIELRSFMKRVEAEFQNKFDCECKLLETLTKWSNENE